MEEFEADGGRIGGSSTCEIAWKEACRVNTVTLAPSHSFKDVTIFGIEYL